MKEWILEKGGIYNNMKMRFYTENNRALHASGYINHGDTVLFIPIDAMIT